MNCRWLLRMLEIAHSLAKLGQKASPVVNKLEDNLQETIRKAMELQDKAIEISDDQVRRKARKELQDLVSRNEKDLKAIKWEEAEIVEKIPNADMDWSELIGLVHNTIGKKVEEKIVSGVSSLKMRHEQELNDMYRTTDEILRALQDGIFGLEGMKEDDIHLKKGISALLTPFLISLGFRAIPYVNPLVLMAAPLIPLGLFGKLVIEDIQESINDTKREKFKDNKVRFMKEEAERILNIAKNDCGEGDEKNSPLLKYFIGDSRNKIINVQIDQVINVAELLLKMSCNKNEESQKCSKRFVIKTMKFYVEKVMKHEFKLRDDIVWLFNEENIRRTIDQGINACTYEATLNGEHG